MDGLFGAFNMRRKKKESELAQSVCHWFIVGQKGFRISWQLGSDINLCVYTNRGCCHPHRIEYVLWIWLSLPGFTSWRKDSANQARLYTFIGIVVDVANWWNDERSDCCACNMFEYLSFFHSLRDKIHFSVCHAPIILSAWSLSTPSPPAPFQLCTVFPQTEWLISSSSLAILYSPCSYFHPVIGGSPLYAHICFRRWFADVKIARFFSLPPSYIMTTLMVCMLREFLRSD